MRQTVSPIISSRLILIPILLLAAFVRFHAIGQQSLWTDEFVSLQLACGRGAVADNLPRDQIIDRPVAPTRLRDAYPIWRIYTHAMEQDTHPPLYPMVLRGWIAIFAESAVAARSLSAIFSLLAIWLLYETVRQMHSAAIAGWAAALLAAQAAQVEFAQLVRSYSMLIALVLACCWIAARIEQFGATPRRCLALGGLAVLSMLTHYYAAPPLLALTFYLLIRLPLRDRFRVISTLLIASLVWLVIWGTGLWHQREHFSLNMQWILEDRAGNPASTLRRALSQPIQFLLEPHHPGWGIAIGSGILLLLPLLALRRRPRILLWELIVIISIAVVAATDLVRSSRMLEYLRYTAVASAAVCAALVVLLEAFAARWWQVAAAVIFLAELFWLPAMYNVAVPDFHGMAEAFASQMNAGDTLVIFQPTTQAWQSDILYFAATHYAHHLPGQAIIMTHPADDATLARLRTADHIWIINSNGAAADAMIPGISISHTRMFPPLAIVEEGTLR